MNLKEGYKLSPQERQTFLEKSRQLAMEDLDQAEFTNLYNDFVSSQKESFLQLINYINEYIYSLKIAGKVSQALEIRARIKGIQSAIRNHEIERKIFNDKIVQKIEGNDQAANSLKDKGLDDVFGIEIICATDNEINFIKENLDKVMKHTKLPKAHAKNNNYKATHCYYSLKDDIMEKIAGKEIPAHKTPILECQYKTIETEVNSQFGGSASHFHYKGESEEKIQKMYDEEAFIIGYNLPLMYVSDINKEGKPVMRLLTLNETLRKEYPFLDMTKSNNRTQ